jgi:flagellin
MRINHSLFALNTYRQLNVNNVNSGAKSLEKLSSGYKASRAAMEAEVASISERMRAKSESISEDSSAVPATAANNLDAAQARVRDVDMAKEMLEFTKTNILNQAATAMLAQANQAPQAVLQLLR